MGKDIKVPFFTALFIFTFLFLYTKLAGPIPFFVDSIQTTKTDLFHISGTGKETAVPNTAVLDIAVTKTATTVQNAQNEANSVMKNILIALDKLGIMSNDIKTTDYAVDPQYDYSNGNQITTGFTVSQNLEVQIKQIDRTNQVIDAATSNGANIVGSLQFILDDTSMKQLKDKAEAEAIADAKDKAQTLAQTAGIHLGKIVDIQEDDTPQPIPVDTFNAAKPLTGGQPTNVIPGKNTISVTVTLSYEIY